MIAGIQLRRFQSHVPDADSVTEEMIFYTFSLSYCVGILALAGGISFLLLKSETIAPLLIVKWVELFRIQEIFDLDFISENLIRSAYHVFVLLVLALVLIRFLLRLVRLALGLLVLSPGRLIAIESNLLKSRIHHIPYARIQRLSTDQTIAHKLLKLGNVEIFTGERQAPLRFGPIPRFPEFLSRLTVSVQRA